MSIHLKNHYRFVILGAGLSGSLIALKMQEQKAGDFLLIEQNSELNLKSHTWSFFASDVSQDDLDFLKKFNLHSWSEHSVYFKKMHHTSQNTYYSLTGSHLENYLMSHLPSSQILLNTSVQVDSATQKITLNDSHIVSCDLIIDARGTRYSSEQIAGYQKFFGLEVDFSKPHGLKHPVLIDARVPQKDGFRFFYCLPLSATQMLIEDTRYSSSPLINETEYTDEIKVYAEKNFSHGYKVLRAERGALPLTKNQTVLPEDDFIITVGTRAGLFHPVTGYSIPFAVRTARFLADQLPQNATSIAQAYRVFQAKVQKQLSLFFKLNFVMFSVASEEERFKLFEHCYTRPEFIVRRFYAGHMSLFEKFLFFIAKPPVSVSKLMKVWYNKRHEKAA